MEAWRVGGYGETFKILYTVLYGCACTVSSISDAQESVPLFHHDAVLLPVLDSCTVQLASRAE